MNKLIITLSIILISFCGYAQSPSRIFSPYSQQGIGELKSDYYSRNFGIANIGIANHDNYSANLANPALLEKNKYTIFDINLGYTQSQLSIDTFVNTQRGGGIKSLAIVMPMSYKWTTAFSLTPISEIAYFATGSAPVNGDTLNNTEITSGSVQRLGWSNGFNVAKGLNVGVGLGFNFGNKVNINETTLLSNKSEDRTDRQTLTTKINGLDYHLGASYSTVITLSKPDSNYVPKTETIYLLNRKHIKKLSKLDAIQLAQLDTINRKILKKRNKLAIDLGAVYSKSMDWNTTNYLVDRYQLTNSSGGLTNYGFQDTTSGVIKMPSSFGLGITIGNVSDTSRWRFSYETTITNWNEYEENGTSLNLPSTMRMAVGFEFTPFINYYDGGLKGIVNRATYKVGAYKTTTPYEVNKTQLEEVGIHFGISFIERPKRLGNKSLRWEKQDERAGYNKTRNYLSRLNVGASVGTLGANESTAIQQMVFKVNVGISLNSEWFVRRKIN